MNGNKFTYTKKEKLCSRKTISALFERGHSFRYGPYRLLWMPCEEDLPYPAQSAVSVGKKLMPRAVDRNRIKRLTREVWRKNKHSLYEKLDELNMKIFLMIVYTKKKQYDYHSLEKQMQELLIKFSLNLESVSGKNNTG